MPTLPLAGLLLALLAAPAAAQTAFVLESPTLRVGSAVRTVVGAPLDTARFEALRLDLPGVGALTVSDRPFAGAGRAGEFDGTGLFVTVDGTSVRLVAARPLLPGRGVTAAFARLDLDARDLSRFARASLVASLDDLARPPAAPAEPVQPRVRPPAEPPAAERPAAEPPSTADQPGAPAGWVPTERLDALDAERAALRAERLALEAERARLAADRAALEADRARLEADHAAARPAPVLPPADAAPADAAPADAAPGAAVSIPDLDAARVQNAPEVLAALAGLQDEVRRRGVRGDALVLFVTDDTGRVVRTAVARPLGGGLDALAEGLVQGIRFVPPLVDGRPAAVRSQLTVRFAP